MRLLVAALGLVTAAHSGPLATAARSGQLVTAALSGPLFTAAGSGSLVSAISGTPPLPAAQVASRLGAARGIPAPGTAVRRDTIRLESLQDAAVRSDPRAAQLDLRDEALRLARESLATERLPNLALRGEGTMQSDVVELPSAPPGGEAPSPPRKRFQVAVEADQLLYDGGNLSGRESVETARHEEALAELEAALYPLRMEVNEAFFAALLLQQREAEIQLLIEDLEARLALARAGVREGARLPGDTAAIAAESLVATQTLEQVEAERSAALRVLGELTGRPIPDSDALVLPDLADAVERVRASGGAEALRERPEFARFELTRARLEREAELLGTRTRPRVLAFGQAGVGRPGPFLLFDDGLNEFWMFGVRLEWQPDTWGATDRRQEILRVQEQIATTEEAAFAGSLERQVTDEEASMSRLESTLISDARIVALREQVERQAAVQYEERVITAAEYIDARTDLLEARLLLQRHRVELEQARARFLTTLGAGLR